MNISSGETFLSSLFPSLSVVPDLCSYSNPAFPPVIDNAPPVAIASAALPSTPKFPLIFFSSLV